MGDTEFDWTSYGPTFGGAHSVSDHEEPPSRVELLRRVVEEVTGQPLPREEKRIGFI